MKKTVFAAILFTLTVIILFSCKPEKKWDCFKGTGKSAIKEVYLTSYDSLYIDGQMTVNLIQDTTDYVVFSGGENLLAKIDATIEDHSMTLKDNNHCRWVRSYKKAKITADVHFSRLLKVIFYKGADLFSPDTLYLDTLIISIWSKIGTVDLLIDAQYTAIKLNAATGDYFLRGKSDFNYMYSVGNGNIYTDELQSKNGDIYCNSTGKTTFWISEKVKLKILNSGNVYYRLPKPTIELVKRDCATGEIFPLSD
ncbi:MAG: hypothetical protein DRP35_09290 [Candidatus Zixiibacteriota bacterium]|nr:MAG: hypothetical protein DRP35_09290 [candidate division Zixibacteria bacterium]